MKRKYAAIVLSMAMVLSPVGVFAADNTAEATETTETVAADDEEETEVSEYIIGQVTKVSDTSIEVKTGEILKEASEDKTEENKDGEKEAEENSESMSLQLKDETQSYDISEDTPLYSATGHNKLEVLEAAKEADDAAAADESTDDANATDEKTDDAEATDGAADDAEAADEKTDDAEATDENADDAAADETTEATDAAAAENEKADDVYAMVVGEDAKISTIKAADIKEGDVIILKLDKDGKVESATVLNEESKDAEEDQNDSEAEASDAGDASSTESKDSTAEDTAAESGDSAN